MKKYFYISILLLFSSTVFAQNMVDALRLSDYRVQGTARATAMGNATGAIGGDFTSLSINPAGIGVYQTNEFTFTPSLKFPKAEIKMGNNLFSENDFKIDLNQLGYVGSVNINDNTSSIVRFNYGIGFNKLKDFDQTFIGNQRQSSLSFLNGIVDYANSEALSNEYLGQNLKDIEYRDWHTKLAWDTYLIDPALDDNEEEIDGQYENILFENENVDQKKSWERSGRINEYLFSAGLNFDHKFYVGATIGIHDIYYKQESFYSEQFTDNSFTFGDEYRMTGTGYVLKIGAIYKPISSVRLGVAFHTPTYYQIEEEQVLSMQSRLQQSYYSDGLNIFEYDFYTPLKTIFSGAFVIGKAAILSFDAEYMDYSTMRYRHGSGGDTMSDLNSNISDVFDNTLNYRLGAEIRVAKGLSLLGGYELYGNPIKENITLNEEMPKNDVTSYSFGIGYSFKNFYIDSAYKRYLGKIELVDPQPNYSKLPLEFTNDNFTFTLGFRF